MVSVWVKLVEVVISPRSIGLFEVMVRLVVGAAVAVGARCVSKNIARMLSSSVVCLMFTPIQY